MKRRPPLLDVPPDGFGGQGEKGMALKDLERLTGELEKLAAFLKAETRPLARRVIMERVQEIITTISLGEKSA